LLCTIKSKEGGGPAASLARLVKGGEKKKPGVVMFGYIPKALPEREGKKGRPQNSLTSGAGKRG